MLNAADYGVLQNRKRVILIGKYGDEENFYPAIEKKERKYTVSEIFRDLPELQAGAGSARPVQTLDYQGTYLYEAGIKSRNNQMITFHNARPNTKQDKEIYKIADAKTINECWLGFHTLDIEMAIDDLKELYMQKQEEKALSL